MLKSLADGQTLQQIETLSAVQVEEVKQSRRNGSPIFSFKLQTKPWSQPANLTELPPDIWPISKDLLALAPNHPIVEPCETRRLAIAR
jgi:hypothetical protein